MKINFKFYFGLLSVMSAVLIIESCQDEPVKKELT